MGLHLTEQPDPQAGFPPVARMHPLKSTGQRQPLAAQIPDFADNPYNHRRERPRRCRVKVVTQTSFQMGAPERRHVHRHHPIAFMPMHAPCRVRFDGRSPEVQQFANVPGPFPKGAPRSSRGRIR